MRFGILAGWVSLAICSIGPGHALAAEPAVMYRCPGNDYNNTLSPKEAKDKGCKTIEGAPITIIQGPKPRGVSSGSPVSAGPAASRIDPVEQRARDNDAKRILEAELKREEERLATMKAEYNNGEPEKQGIEGRNYQRYLDRVSDMKDSIARSQSDIAGLKREISRLPASN